MEHGSIIDYVRWRSLISTYRAPHRFVDERLLGPYSFWHRRVEDPRAVRVPMRLQTAAKLRPYAAIDAAMKACPTIEHSFGSGAT
jgi:hypothetical protein